MKNKKDLIKELILIHKEIDKLNIKITKEYYKEKVLKEFSKKELEEFIEIEGVELDDLKPIKDEQK